MEDFETVDQLKGIKMRDLSQTYFYKIASRVFGPAKTRSRVFIAPPMSTLNSAQTPSNQMTYKNGYVPVVYPGAERRNSGSSLLTMPPRGDVANLEDWVNQRRTFRRELDNLGDLTKWFHNKPTVTELEMLVVEREKKIERTPSPRLPCVSLTPPDTGKTWTRHSRRATESRGRIVHSQQREMKEFKRDLDPIKHLPVQIAKRHDRHSTRKLRRDDLRFVFEKEGISPPSETLDKLVTSVGEKDGDHFTVKDLAEYMKTWSQDKEVQTSCAGSSLAECGELPLNLQVHIDLEKGAAEVEPENLNTREQHAATVPGQGQLGNHGLKEGLAVRRGAQLLSNPEPEWCLRTPLSLEEQEEQASIQQHRRPRGMKVMQDEEALTIIRSLCIGNSTQDAHSKQSSLGGSTGRAVDRFRRQCLGEYLDSLDQCRTKGIVVNQSALERVLLHPGDCYLGGPERPVLRQAGSSPLPGCRGRLRGWISWNSGTTPREEKEEEENHLEEEVAPHKVRKQTPVYPSQKSVQRGPKMMTLSTGRAEVAHKTECWLTREEYAHMTRNMREPSCHRANPNAFWPGQDDHVRLYLPQVGIPQEGVLFQHITRSPAPSPGNWPVNNRGYYTSGNIDGHKAYTL